MTADSTAAAPTAAAGTGRLVGQYEPGSDEWRQARAGCITATRIAAVLGLSPWESPFSLWHRMRGTVSDEVEISPEMEWGTRLEPAVLGKFADEHPEWTLLPAGTWAHRDRPWQRATPDGLLVPPCDCGIHNPAGCCDPRDCGPCCERCPTCPSHDRYPAALVEAKTSPMGEGWASGIPVYYETQVQWQMDVLGVSVTHVAVLISGHDYREYEIAANPDEQAFMRDRAIEFLDSLDTGTPPKIDGHDRTYDTVRQLPDGVDDVAVDIGPALADRYESAREAAREIEAELSEAKSLMLDRMGRARRAESLGDPIAYRTTYPNGKTRALYPARRQNRNAS